MAREKKKGKFLKFILIVVAIFFVILLISALLDDGESNDSQASYDDSYSSEDNSTYSDGNNSGGQAYGGVDYVVQDPVGEYRKFNSRVADNNSEEISELANGKHFINEAFDFTEYATTINEKHSGNWGIYIYVCGSNLESDGGAATEDISEILNANLPDNSNVVIQAGGASSWNLNIDPNSLQRLVYDGSNFELVDSGKQVNMGQQASLENFLSFCKTNYPADNEIVIFWNHGGASISGACYDELYNDDHLTLNEIDNAFSNVYGKERIEMVGFDCCLMATLDTAELLRNHAKMLVASEELEPGNGWYYTDWLNDLASDPSMSNAKLGKAICDSFLGGCQMYGTDDEATLSAIDLTQINLVTASMNALGSELLGKATNGDADIFATFGRAAQKAENYGGNNDSSGYFDMVDLGDLYDQCKGALDSENYARYALSRAVVYNVHGSYRSQSTGISVFYPYDKTEYNMQKIEAVTASDIYTSALRYAVTGELSQEAVDLINMYGEKADEFSSSMAESGSSSQSSSEETDSSEYDEVYDGYYEDDDDYYEEYRSVATKSIKAATVSSDSLAKAADQLVFKNDGKDLEIYIDDDGYISTDIGKNIDAVESVICDFLMYDEKNDTYVALGYDNDVDVDWETGAIKDNFRGVWACLGGHRLYLDLTYEGDDYNLYSVPVTVNDKDMDMSISYDYKTDSFKILGLSDSVDTDASNVYATKSDIMPKAGDKFTLIGYSYDYDNEDWVEIELDSFTYEDGMTITEEDLGDGQFAIMFITTDVAGNEVFSEYGYIDYYDGEISTYTEDELEEE